MKFETETAVEILDTVIRLRKSVRAFRSDPVPKRLLMEIVEAARPTQLQLPALARLFAHG